MEQLHITDILNVDELITIKHVTVKLLHSKYKYNLKPKFMRSNIMKSNVPEFILYASLYGLDINTSESKHPHDENDTSPRS